MAACLPGESIPAGSWATGPAPVENKYPANDGGKPLKNNMNVSDYPNAARRVLNTVNQMFVVYFWKTVFMPRFEGADQLHLPSIALENATVESSLIAIRAFDDFIKSNKKHPDDLVAIDFPFLSLSGNGICNLERVKINKQIAHLTTIDLSSNSQTYSYRKSLGAVIPAAIKFCEYVANELSDDSSLAVFATDTKRVCEMMVANYVNKSAV
jgi:hypothetical protein